MSLQRNVVASYLASGWAALVGLTVLPLYIRYLGIESYGLIGFFVTLQAWFFLLDMGFSLTLNREMARFTAGLHSPQSIGDLLISMETVFIIIAIFLGLLVSGTSSWIASDWLKLQTLSVDTATEALVIMGLAMALQWMGTLYRSALFGLQRHVWLSFASASFATIRAVGAVSVLAFISPTIVAFTILQCGVSLVETILLAWYVRSSLPRTPRKPIFNPDALRKIWPFAAGLALISFLGTLLTQVDKLLLTKFLPLEQFGYFSIAITVVGVLSLLVGPVHNVAYPRLTELVVIGNEMALAREYHRFSQLVAIAVLPAALILCVFSKEIVLLWTQDITTAQIVAPIVTIWGMGTALNGLMHIPYAAQLAHGWAKLSIVLNAGAVIIMIPAMLYWVPKHGAIAAAWIWVAINVGYTIFGITAMHTRILRKEKLKWYAEDVLGPFLVGALVTWAMSIFRENNPIFVEKWELVFLMVTAIAVLIAVAVATPLRSEIFNSARRFVVKTCLGK